MCFGTSIFFAFGLFSGFVFHGFRFNADGTGYLQRGNITEKITFSDNGDGTYKMSTEHAQTPITEGYRIEGDTLYTIDKELGIEEAYTRKQ